MFVNALHKNCFLIFCIRIVMGQLNFIETEERKFDVIGVFPLNLDDIDPEILLWVEAFRYYMAKMNENCNVFSYRIYDSGKYERNDHIADIAVETLLDENNMQNIFSVNCSCKKGLDYKQGIIGPATSARSVIMSNILSSSNIFMISYFATSDELDNTERYPNFLRTIPADSELVKVLVKFLNELNWKYVSVIYESSPYGESGYKSIIDEKICLSIAIRMNNLNETIHLLKNDDEKSNVIVLYGLKNMVRDVLERAHKEQIINKIWVLCHISGKDSWFLQFSKTFKGHLFFLYPATSIDEGFRDHFLNLSYTSREGSQWTRRFFESKGITNITNGTKLSYFSTDLDFSYVGFVKKAVLAYTQHVLKNIYDSKPRGLCGENFSSIIASFLNSTNPLDLEFSKIDLRENLVQYSFNIDVMDNNRTRFNFVDTAEMEVQIKPFGTYSASNRSIITVNQTLFMKFFNIKSLCSETCGSGHAFQQIGIKSCCWHCPQCSANSIKKKDGKFNCTKCPDDTLSNRDRTKCLYLLPNYIRFYDYRGIIIFSFSMTSVVLNIFVMAVFVSKRQTPVIRSSNFTFSMVQLTCHLAIFVLNTLCIGEQNLLKCRVRRYGTWFSYTIIISIVITKVTRLLVIFRTNRLITRIEISRQKRKDIFIITVCVITHLSLLMMLRLFYGITIEEFVEENSSRSIYDISSRCTNDILDIASIFYILLLQIICGIQSFRGRTIPTKYNEAKYVSYAMFLSTFSLLLSVLLANSIQSYTVSLLLEACMTMLANLSILVSLYYYKLWVIFVHPEENTAAVFQQQRFSKIIKKQSSINSAFENFAFHIDLGK